MASSAGLPSSTSNSHEGAPSSTNVLGDWLWGQRRVCDRKATGLRGDWWRGGNGATAKGGDALFWFLN